jgi:hypothetical protein
MVTCQFCKSEFRVITYRHVAQHGITISEYRDRYPDSPLADAAFIHTASEISRDRWQDPEVRKRREKSLERSHQSPKRKAAVSAALKQSWSEDRETRLAQVRDGLNRYWTPEQRTARGEQMSELWHGDRIRRKKAADRIREEWESGRRLQQLREGLARYWTPERRAAHGEAMRKRWRDPDYVQKIKDANADTRRGQPSAYRWTEPERIVRGWLEAYGLYETAYGYGFVAHGWLPVTGFAANADFVDYRHQKVIHVDGSYWHGANQPTQVRHDRRLDAWCMENGWSFVRLDEQHIRRHPIECQALVFKLLQPGYCFWRSLDMLEAQTTDTAGPTALPSSTTQPRRSSPQNAMKNR